MKPFTGAIGVLSVLAAVLALAACASPGGTVAVVAVGNLASANAPRVGSNVITVGVPRHSAPSGSGSNSNTLSSSTAPVKVRVLPLDDDRKDLDTEGTATAAFGVPMGRVRFDPGPATLLGQAITSEVKAAGHAVTDRGGDGVQITGSVLEFDVHTDTTPLYWDVVGKLAVSLQVSAQGTQLAALPDYRARCMDRTYRWPTDAVIAGVMGKCIDDFARQLRTDDRVAAALRTAAATPAVAQRTQLESQRKASADALQAATDRSHASAEQRWSVLFPSDWALDDSDRFVKISKGPAILGIHHAAVGAGQSLDEVADSAIRDWELQMKNVAAVRRVSRQRVTLAGNMAAIAIVHHIGTGRVGQSRKVIVVANDRRYLIDAETYLASWPDFERDFDRIIGSFRVLE